MGTPLAFFLTWTCYGTWLPGDARGSVNDWQSTFGTPVFEPDDTVVRDAAMTMAETPFWMNDGDRVIVDAAIRKTCLIRVWTVHAVNVRTNHVHVVLTARDVAPERAMATLKSWATRALKTAGGHTDRTRFWTNQGSNRWLWADEHVRAAVAYTLDQ